jgi:hypothetical protein
VEKKKGFRWNDWPFLAAAEKGRAAIARMLKHSPTQLEKPVFLAHWPRLAPML